MKTALKTSAAPATEKYLHWVQYLAGVAEVQFRVNCDGDWFWSHPRGHRPGDAKWHGPFRTKGEAAVDCANYDGWTVSRETIPEEVAA